MKLFDLKITALLVAITVAPSAIAQNVLMSEDAAMNNFKEAAKLFRKNEVGPSLEKAEPEALVDSVADIAEETPSTIVEADIKIYEDKPAKQYKSIENIDVSVNIENKSIETLVQTIIDQAREETGKWTVKWRVSPESNYILSERVNLTAETNLSSFMSFLVDRVNNMTGVKLFVTVFDKSRIILISDTYY